MTQFARRLSLRVLSLVSRSLVLAGVSIASAFLVTIGMRFLMLAGHIDGKVEV